MAGPTTSRLFRWAENGHFMKVICKKIQNIEIKSKYCFKFWTSFCLEIVRTVAVPTSRFCETWATCQLSPEFIFDIWNYRLHGHFKFQTQNIFYDFFIIILIKIWKVLILHRKLNNNSIKDQSSSKTTVNF